MHKPSVRITTVATGKKRYLSLLLLADEQESMIDRYLERGELLVMDNEEGETIAVAVVTDEGHGHIELKNLAVAPGKRGMGYGKRMIAHIRHHYADRHTTLLVGTGDVPSTIGFYTHCGFVRSHRIPHFFTTHYDHPIHEDGVQLDDMVYLKMPLRE